MSEEAIIEQVRARYARTARRVLEAGTNPKEALAVGCCGDPATEAVSSGCCGTAGGCCGTPTSALDAARDPITAELYAEDEVAGLPLAARLASLGCGNPTALAELRPGERVLDLGSGGGIDVLLSARRVGPEGMAFGLDMTDEMLELAERNRQEAGVTNVRFLKGQIEAIPLADASVDVVISNCVINLSADKGRVLREAYRVLAPAGRFAVSDIVVQGAMPSALRANMEAWAGCVAGALEEAEYRRLLVEAGFGEIEVEVTRRFEPEEIGVTELEMAEEAHTAAGRFVSAFIRARKPAGG